MKTEDPISTIRAEPLPSSCIPGYFATFPPHSLYIDGDAKVLQVSLAKVAKGGFVLMSVYLGASALPSCALGWGLSETETSFRCRAP